MKIHEISCISEETGICTNKKSELMQETPIGNSKTHAKNTFALGKGDLCGLRAFIAQQDAAYGFLLHHANRLRSL